MRILCLFHRVPFPPDKGEKLRAHHQLRALARHFTLEVAAFHDEGPREEAEAFLAAHAEHWTLVPLGRLRPLLRGALALAAGRPLSAGYFRHSGIAAAVEAAIARGAAAAHVFSGPMARYLLPPDGRARLPFLLDLVDVDSAKWEAYARRGPGALGPLYALEARRLAAFERRAAAAAGRVTLVSAAEAALLRARAPELADERVAVLENGVDTAHFAPRPREEDAPPALIFTGRMDYRPNVEGICWFAEHVWPQLAARHAGLRLLVVGAEPAPAVRRLARDPRITVTGRVADVRPFYARADVAIAPLLIARGIQNKLLEAMAMARPVVASPAAFTGLDERAAAIVKVADAPGEWVAAIEALLADPAARARLGEEGRRFVTARYGWAARGEELVAMIRDLAAGGNGVGTAP
ncbi:MAG: glycosyl transferase [Rhodothalassiaceae bacterium]|nr:MAG: glycosyl transferase [Rhodothalassiaceae bacterium]